MKKDTSIFNKLLYNSVILSTIPFLILICILCKVSCSTYKNEQIQNISEDANEYVHLLNSKINESLEKSEYIIKNVELLEMLNADSDELSILYDISKQISDYINIINNSQTDDIMIFSTGNFYEGRYLSKMSRLPNAESLRKEFTSKKIDIIWEDDLFYTDENKPYFVYYKDLYPYADSIVRFQVFLPDYITEAISLEKVYDSQNKNAVYIPIQVNDNYFVVSQIDESDLYAKYTEYVIIYLIIAITFCITLILLSFIINKKITGRINSFVADLSQKDPLQNEIDFYPNSKDSSELKIIKKSISSLVSNVRDANRAHYQTELEKKQLALNLLQSKLSPHILYNSLSAITLKAFKSNDNDIINIIENLTSYYRAVLANGKDIVTVAEELDMIKKYVQISEIAYSKKIDLQILVPETFYENKILNLLLQPFVENAIIHGLSGKNDSGLIFINCRPKEDKLVFQVYDNGYGIPQETVDKLNNIMTNEKSYGIKNSVERIHLFCGEDCGVFFESFIKGGTSVYITVPAELS